MRTLFIYIGVTLFVALFGGIYELNSNNVYSAAMLFAWRYPLILGVFMYLIIRFLPTNVVPGILPASVYNLGVAIATMRSVFIGVIDIYGTTNKNMVTVYTVLTWVFLLVGLASYFAVLIYWAVQRTKRKKNAQ